MQRFNDMLVSISDLSNQLLNKQRILFKEGALSHSQAIEEIIRDIQQSIDDSWENKIYITFLRSSYVTNSNKIKIAIYQKEPFVEEPLAYVYYQLSPYLDTVKDDIEIIKKTLNYQFVQVRSCEIEEMRRWYMEQLYMAAKIIFETIFTECKQDNNGRPIFYGSEMGQVELIGKWKF